VEVESWNIPIVHIPSILDLLKDAICKWDEMKLKTDSMQVKHSKKISSMCGGWVICEYPS
jgi:hypothetical protein